MGNMKIVSALRMTVVFLGIGTLVLCCVGAVAQPPGPGGTRHAPEKNEKAWEIEAKTIAGTLELSAEQTPKLVEAYKAARESQMAAIRAKMEEQQEGGRRNYQAYRKVNEAERAKLETALKAFLTPESTAKALATLGTFSRRWDPMVTVLDVMNLEKKARGEAMKRVATYVAESSKALQAAMAAEDFESMREQFRKRKEALDADLAKILSAEQTTQWKEATTMRRGGRRH